MIGEIRDKPTVQIAVESALTGHLVFSTLHTNDAAGVVTRLLDMGVEPFLINASLTAVLAQRLVRKLCQCCKQEVVLSSEEQTQMRLYGVEIKKVFRAGGCTDCFNVGYKGRVGLFELLLLNDEIRRLVICKSSAEMISRQAEKDGMITFFQDGVNKVNQGIISLAGYPF